MERDKKQELISVIVPVYNIMDCLPRCVHSICAQTYQNLEILLIDDGSTDGTGALADRLAQEDQRIRVFHKENGGSSSARNLGIAHAKGQWIGFVDSDDYIDSQMYESLINGAIKWEVCMAQISRDEIDEAGNRLPDVCIPPEHAKICPPATFMRELLLHRGDCSFCTKLVRRELFEHNRFPEGVLNEDFYLLVQLLPHISGAVILPEQLYHVFYRVGSNTRKKDKNEFSRVFTDIVVNADMAEDAVSRYFPKLKQEAVRFGLYQRLDYLLHIPVSQMRADNSFYQTVNKYLKKHLKDIFNNPYLTRKNRIYLLLLSLAPLTVRRLHAAKIKWTEQKNDDKR